MNTQCQSYAKVRNETQWNAPNPEKINGQAPSASENIMPFNDDATLDTLINQIEFVRVLSGTKSINDFNQRILTVLEPLGFSDFALVRRKNNGRIEVPLCSMPKALMEMYEAEKYCRHDMVLDYLDAGNLDPIYLSMVKRTIDNVSLMTRTFKRNQEILSLYEQFELYDAYLIPVRFDRGEENERGIFWAIARGVGFDDFSPLVERCKPVLRLLADTVNFIGFTRYYSGGDQPGMGTRPLRLLSTMAKNDLSLSQAADVLCISIDTANKHMAMAKKALGTSSQANAVYLALKQGLIDL